MLAAIIPATPARPGGIPRTLPRWSVLAGLALVFWPLGSWWVGRAWGAAEGGWPLLALATLAVLTPWRAFGEPIREASLVRLAAGLAVVLPFLMEGLLPPLVRAGVAACFVALLWRECGAAPAVCLMPFLALPVMDTADFYLGYPLRVGVAQASGFLLQAAGWAVSVSGTGLTWEGREVVVDAPCSGLRMLGFGAWMTLVAAALSRLTVPALALLGAAALVLLVALNILRATVLFFPESGLATWPAAAHEAVGAVCFLAAGSGILTTAHGLQRMTNANTHPGPEAARP